MTPTIKRIDTALLNHIRSFVTHHQTPKSPMTATKARHDMMNTSQISHVMSALSSATETASKQATETINTYNNRQHAQKIGGSVNRTQQRLIRMNHSSVSQDISQLLLSFSTKQVSSTSNTQSWIVERREGNFEVGVRELARAGVFGRDGDSSRLMELAL